MAQSTGTLGEAEALNKCAFVVVPGVNVVALASLSLDVMQTLKFQLPGFGVTAIVENILK